MERALNRFFNMETLLAVCTIEEERAVIRFLSSEGGKPREIHGIMLQQYACIDERKMRQ